MSHEDWFQDLWKLEWPSYVETGNCNIYPIQHVGSVPFGEKGNETYIKNILHVPTMTNNLVLVGQIVEQGMQVRLNDEGCFIEKEGWFIARGRRQGQMFILDSHEMKSTMFAKATKPILCLQP